MFALYKTTEFLVHKLHSHFKIVLGNDNEVTILRFLRDLKNFKECA